MIREITMTVWVVDQDGATYVFLDQEDAERFLVSEAYAHAVHLTITKADAPFNQDEVTDDLINWCIANVSPTICEVQ